MKRQHWTDRAQSWRVALLIWALFAAVLCFGNLGGFGIISMEGMVADGGRAMLETGEWAVPTVYGEMYTFKPALAYWLSAWSQHFVGTSEWALRLPFATCGAALGLLVLIVIGRRLGPRVGLFAALAAMGGGLFLEKVRLAEFDTPLALGVGIAVAAAVSNLSRQRPSFLLWLAAYAGLTVGFLGKGVPALMAFAPGLLLAAAWNRRLPSLFSWRHLAPFLFFVGSIAAYLWWAVDGAGWQVFDQPLREARFRGATWDAASLARTVTKPLLILGAFLPWSLPLALTEAKPWRRCDPVGAAWRAGAAFLLAGTAFYVAVPTHEMRYYLPLATANAIVAAISLELALARPVSRRFVALLRGLLASVAVVAIGLTTWERPDGGLALVVVFALLGSAAFARRTARGTTVATLVVALSLLVGVAEAWVLMPRRASTRDQSVNAAELKRYLPEGEVVWTQGPSDAAGKHSSLYHYLDHPIRTFDHEHPPPPGAFVIAPSPSPISPIDCAPYEGAAVIEFKEPRLAIVQHHEGEFSLLRPGLGTGDVNIGG